MSRMAREVVVAAERLQRWIDGFSERHGGATTNLSPTEVHLVGADETQAWLAVPFPPLPEDADLAGFVAHVTRSRRVGVLLVRRGGYAVGVFDGTELAASKTGSSYVQGSTKAGGWSQQRFARRRANQARAAFEAAADAAGRGLAGRHRRRGRQSRGRRRSRRRAACSVASSACSAVSGRARPTVAGAEGDAGEVHQCPGAPRSLGDGPAFVTASR
jgi:hypothetical protein